jgi:hypothetical protein
LLRGPSIIRCMITLKRQYLRTQFSPNANRGRAELLSRGNGYGKSLLLYLSKIAKDKEFGRVEWAVLDWNQPAIDFYNSLGARQMDEWIINRVSGKTLDDLANQF